MASDSPASAIMLRAPPKLGDQLSLTETADLISCAAIFPTAIANEKRLASFECRFQTEVIVDTAVR